MTVPLKDPNMRWMSKANCQGVPVSVFFPKSGTRPHDGLLLCQTCVVKDECLNYALVNNIHWGLWGGMTERERFREKQRRRRLARVAS